MKNLVITLTILATALFIFADTKPFELRYSGGTWETPLSFNVATHKWTGKIVNTCTCTFKLGL